MRAAILTTLIILLPLPARAVVVTARHVLERTYTENLRAKSIQLERDISREDVRLALSQYDPLLTGEAFYEKDTSQRATTVFGTSSSETRYSLGITQLAPSGTAVTLTFLTEKQTTNSIFATNPSLFDTRTILSISQPVLNNFFGFANRKSVALARQTQEAVATQVDSRLLDLAYANLVTYWNWYLYQQLVVVNRDAVSAARRLYQTNRQKMVIGLIEESDLNAFAANVDLTLSELYIVQGNLDAAEAPLRVALNYPRAPLVPGREHFGPAALPAVETMIREALINHPEYVALKKTLAAQNISVALEEKARLPQVDLNGSLTLNGIDPAFATAVDNIGNGNTIWQVGVNLSFPILNRQARAAYNKSKLKKAQLLYALKNLETRIIARVRKGYDKYIKSLKRMRVVANAVHNQRLKWEGEVKKYDQGRSDPDLVIRYQNDYLNAKKLYVQAQVDYQLSRLELDYARGRLDY